MLDMTDDARRRTGYSVRFRPGCGTEDGIPIHQGEIGEVIEVQPGPIPALDVMVVMFHETMSSCLVARHELEEVRWN